MASAAPAEEVVIPALLRAARVAGMRGALTALCEIRDRLEDEARTGAARPSA